MSLQPNDLLPPELWITILGSLDVKSLATARLSCTALARLGAPFLFKTVELGWEGVIRQRSEPRDQSRIIHDQLVGNDAYKAAVRSLVVRYVEPPNEAIGSRSMKLISQDLHTLRSLGLLILYKVAVSADAFDQLKDLPLLTTLHFEEVRLSDRPPSAYVLLDVPTSVQHVTLLHGPSRPMITAAIPFPFHPKLRHVFFDWRYLRILYDHLEDTDTTLPTLQSLVLVPLFSQAIARELRRGEGTWETLSSIAERAPNLVHLSVKDLHVDEAQVLPLPLKVSGILFPKLHSFGGTYIRAAFVQRYWPVDTLRIYAGSLLHTNPLSNIPNLSSLKSISLFDFLHTNVLEAMQVVGSQCTILENLILIQSFFGAAPNLLDRLPTLPRLKKLTFLSRPDVHFPPEKQSGFFRYRDQSSRSWVSMRDEDIVPVLSSNYPSLTDIRISARHRWAKAGQWVQIDDGLDPRYDLLHYEWQM